MVNPQLQVLPFFGAFKKFICGVFWCFTTWHTEQAKTGSRVASKCIWFSEQPWRSFAAQELDVALCHRTIPWVPRCRFEQSTRWSMMSWAIDLWGVQGVLKLRSVESWVLFDHFGGPKFETYPDLFLLTRSFFEDRLGVGKVSLQNDEQNNIGKSCKWPQRQESERFQYQKKGTIV